MENEFMDEVNEMDAEDIDILKKIRDSKPLRKKAKENGIYVSRPPIFWKVFSILCLLAFLTFIYFVVFTDKLDGLIKPNFDNDVEVSNLYDIQCNSTANIENEYEHNIQTNSTIINNVFVPEDLCSYCP